MDGDKNRPVIPPHIRGLTPYQPGKTVEEVKNTYNPPRIAKLASNENRWGYSRRVKPAVEKMWDKIQDYPDPIARRLRAKIAERNGVRPENIILACGSESLIANVCRTFFMGDEGALTADITFASFFVFASGQDISIRRVPLTADHRFDLQAMADAISESTKLIYIANPNNPTGTYVTIAEFETFMDQVPPDVLVVMDEAYFEYACDLEDYPDSLDNSYKNVLTLRTFSKAYGLAGFRIGYGIGDREIIEMMMKTKLSFEPTTMAQVAAFAAYDDNDFIDLSRRLVGAEKRQLYSFFDKFGINYVPSAANFVLMMLPNAHIARNFNTAMLNEGVILRQMGGVGLPNGIRITIGTEDEMEHFRTAFQKVHEKILVDRNE